MHQENLPKYAKSLASEMSGQNATALARRSIILAFLHSWSTVIHRDLIINSWRASGLIPFDIERAINSPYATDEPYVPARRITPVTISGEHITEEIFLNNLVSYVPMLHPALQPQECPIIAGSYHGDRNIIQYFLSRNAAQGKLLSILSA